MKIRHGSGVEFSLSENSNITLPCTRDKGVLPWQLSARLKAVIRVL